MGKREFTVSGEDYPDGDFNPSQAGKLVEKRVEADNESDAVMAIMLLHPNIRNIVVTKEA